MQTDKLKNALKWWKRLPFVEQWNISINNIKCPDALTDDEILDYYKKENT